VPAHITQSNGGVISFEVAEREPVRTILSGPSTGVIGATYVARLAGYDNIITFDMGGTSTDVSLIERGRPRLAGETNVQGYPIKTPMLDINTIGAGGGSIAWIDSGGHLKVGPRSAGAVPGPVCYGLGNVEPTVTDANVVLQTLNPSSLLAGQMRIAQEAARTAIGRLATQLGLDVMATAQGILSVVTANMARAVRVISVQRGYDPRDYALVAFGGAGPLHAARLARELAMPRVIIPESPGLLCALGLLMTDLRTNYSQTRLLPADERSLSAMTETFAMLEERATAWFEQEGIEPSRRQLRRSVDMRYAGQNYELTVEAPPGAVTAQSLGQLLDGFAHAHEQMYGYVAPEEPVQVVTFRLEASGLAHKVELRAEPEQPAHPEAARSGERRAYLPEAGGWTDCPVYERSLLRAGFQIAGPAVVEQMDSTTLVLPGQVARVDPYRNLLLEDVR
jgi:N-methylhydantoinase A